MTIKHKLCGRPSPRHPILQNLVGSYSVVGRPEIHKESDEYMCLRAYWLQNYYNELNNPDYNYWNEDYWVNSEADKWIEEIITNNSFDGRIKLSKILKRINRQMEFNNLCSPTKNVDIWISVRYNDILRCSITKNFTSCFNPDGCNSHIPARMVNDEAVAIMFVRDAAGKFSSRCFLYLVKIEETGNFAVGIGRVYGETKQQQYIAAVFQAVKKLESPIPILTLYDCENTDTEVRPVTNQDYYSDIFDYNYRIRGEMIMPSL